MKVCRRCGVELTKETWYSSQRKMDNRQCKDCLKKTADTYNETRLYIDGKYIGKKTSLYKMLKPGRYETQDGNGLLNIIREEDTKVDGFVYVITNKAWPEWVKIGMAVDAVTRCNGYQTSSPYRDFVLEHSVPTGNRRKAEQEAHTKAISLAIESSGEWFKLSVEQAINILDNLNDNGLRATKEADTHTQKDKLQERPIQADFGF